MIEPIAMRREGITLNEIFDRMILESDRTAKELFTVGRIYNRHVRDFIGMKDVSVIVPDDIISLCVKLSYLGWDIASIELLCSFLSLCLSEDEVFGVSNYDPAKKAINFVRGIDDKMITLTDEQGLENLRSAKERMLSYFDRAHSPMWKAFFTIAYATGLSYRRLCALHWQDIDFENRVIRSSNTTGYEFGKYTMTKAKHAVQIPMVDRLRDDILRYKYELYCGKLEELCDISELAERFLFLNHLGHPLRFGNVSSHLNQAIAEINLKEYVDAFIEARTPRIVAGFRQKDFRNHFIVRMSELGFRPASISTMVPGESIATIEEVIKRLKRTKESQSNS